ncbi:hypothetical protein NM688_g8142 [Phlebia brevispora]|uniref:Uncharacterized protein n=1 Tax=Phlebia brevispora TaxID=194682 RepID=A0ACC1RWY9_9APHY|nr:hypothetical protein NM688_g8142 [Phlebia brevispora]
MVALTAFIAPTAGDSDHWITTSVRLSGILTVQVYFYLMEYGEDPTPLKAFVVFVWLVEYAQSAFCIHVVHTYVSTDFENVLGIAHIVWSVGVFVALEVLLIALIQIFYIYRAWLLSNRNWIVATVPVRTVYPFCAHFLMLSHWKGVTLSLRAGFGFATAALTYKHTTWVAFREAHAVKYTVNTALGLGIIVDLMVAVFLVYELRSEAGFSLRPPVPYVQTILVYAMGTGASTLVASLMFCAILATVVYANTMLANLNARKRIRNTMIASPRAFNSNTGSSGSANGQGTTRIVARENVKVQSEMVWEELKNVFV